MTTKSPFNSVGLFTFLRTYARRHDEADPNSTIENWDECITRIVKATNDQLKVGFTPDEQQELYNLLFNLKCSVAGRFLWQLGTTTVSNLGLPSLQNCSYVTINEPIVPFTWAMNFLMLGSGVGFGILPDDVAKLPVVHKAVIVRKDCNDADFIVPDSREGWIKLLGKVLKAHFYGGGGFNYSCSLLRSKGAPIKGFGGIASGPDVLCDGMGKISEILNKRAGMKIRPIDALDIMNVIGMIVVSGNVRRSAQIAIGDVHDPEYLKAKDWGSGTIPNYRCHSNNSVVCNNINDIIDNEEFWKGYEGHGEPYGLINLDLHKKCGRIGETQYADPTVEGVNPCSEISLSNYETCCLSELYLPNIVDYNELLKCIQYMYRVCKHSLTLHCKDSKETENIVHKNMRIGIGVTGYMQATEEQKNWLKDAYVYLREYDRDYSKSHSLPVSVKLTTVKPSGTLSLLAGVTSGIHPGYCQYYIRRIRISAESPLVKIAQNHGYHVEPQKRFDGSLDHNTLVIEFPYSLPAHTVFADDCSAVRQLEVLKRIQQEWSDNSVSVTVTYKPEELPSIKQWLRENYNDYIKSVSFLLFSGHGFVQAPIEPITKERYEEIMSKTRPIEDLSGICFVKENDDLIGAECANGMCPLK